MNTFDELFSVEPESWLDVLPNYQKSIITSLYSKQPNYETVAQTWLTASISNTAPFGTEERHSIFYDKVLDEVEAFLNGEERYKENRLSISKESGAVQNFVVGSISVVISNTLGTSAVFLAPVIAIIFVTISKMGINAWLATRKEKREQV